MTRNREVVSGISTHSLTRRLTRQFVNFLFLYNFNSQPHKEADGNFIQQKLLLIFHFYNNLPISPTFSPPLPSFSHPVFTFSAKISGANLPGIGWELGVRTIGSGCR